ncbi:MAG: alpha/beta hydrolase, partial [Armatimonadetes bacterium]|nr:alpha/beta hydrolase [Candidatus Hippobium faecium]
RYIRANAEKYDINPDCLGIMGFSAGGHLASWVSTKWDDNFNDRDDLYGIYSARPDFSVLIYPVTDLYKDIDYNVTGLYLLGENASVEMRDSLSTQNLINENTPPTFLYHTMSDNAVPVICSVKYYEKMAEWGVRGELHIYEPGLHGLGLVKGLDYIEEADSFVYNYCKDWSDNLKNWIINMI